MDADGLLRDRRGTFSTCVDVSGSLAKKGGPWTPTVFCVTGVTLSASQARFVWHAWHFQYLHRCQRKLGDEGGPTDADGLLRGRCDTFSTSQLDLRGRCGTFSTFIDVCGSLATNGYLWAPRPFA